EGTTIHVELPWTLPEMTVVYALTGVHDPFNPTGWRPLAVSPSPWAYSGGEQTVPVIDLLAPDQDTQVRALRTGVLPQPSVPARDLGVLWLVLMGIGVAVAVTGLLLRRSVPAPVRQERRTGLPPDPDAPQLPRVATAAAVGSPGVAPIPAPPDSDASTSPWTAVVIDTEAEADVPAEDDACDAPQTAEDDGTDADVTGTGEDDETSTVEGETTEDEQAVAAMPGPAGAEARGAGAARGEEAAAAAATPTPLAGNSAVGRSGVYGSEAWADGEGAPL